MGECQLCLPVPKIDGRIIDGGPALPVIEILAAPEVAMQQGGRLFGEDIWKLLIHRHELAGSFGSDPLSVDSHLKLRLDPFIDEEPYPVCMPPVRLRQPPDIVIVVKSEPLAPALVQGSQRPAELFSRTRLRASLADIFLDEKTGSFLCCAGAVCLRNTQTGICRG